jgi:type I restriction enzyme S subunit
MKKGWETEPLGELCDIRNGSTPSKGNSTFWDGGTIPWFTIDDMREQGREISSTRQKITKSALSETSVKLLPEDSVLLCCTASVGEFAITRIPLTTNQQFNGLVVKNRNQLDPNFLFHYASTLKDELLGLSGKTTIDFIPISRLRDVAVPVPPLAEQQRIVGLLDEAFEGLATAKANAEKNLQNARALFESHLQSVFTQRGPGWVEKHLKEVCEKITDGTHQTPKYFDEGIVFLSSRNVTSGTIDWDRIKYIDTKQHLEMHKRVAPRRNDILLAKNGTTGVAAIVDRDTTFDIYVSLALLRALPVMRPRFLLHFINSPAAKVQFNKRLKGVGVPNLHLEEIREVRLAFPADLKAQDRVVDELDDLREETQRLARLYSRKHAALEALKKSLLHQAFSGAL